MSSRHGDIRGHTGGESLRQIRKRGRTNEDGYDVQLELEALNEDEAPGCAGPLLQTLKLFAIQRDGARPRSGSLLARQDYRAGSRRGSASARIFCR